MFFSLLVVCPGWVNSKRKRHIFGNEYHTIVNAETKTIFGVEIVEKNKDIATKGPYAKMFKDKNV